MGNTSSCSTEDHIDEYTINILRRKCETLIQECHDMSTTLEEKICLLKKQHAVEIERLQSYNDELCEENESLHTEKERLAQKRRSDAVAIKLLNSELDNRNKTISKLHQSIATKNEENDMIRDELGDCVENIENITDENYTLEQEHDEMKEQVKKLKDSTVAKSEYEAIQNELKDYQVSAETLIQTLRDEIKALQNENTSLKTSIDSNEEVNQYNTDVILRFEEREENLNNEIETLKNQLETRVIEKRALVDEFNDTVDKLHITKEDAEGLQKELRIEREKQITLKKLNFTLKHELKSVAKTMKKERKKAIRTFIVNKMKTMCESSFQDECLNMLMNETWIPNNFERWFYEDIYSHIMMYVHSLLSDDKTE